MNTYDHTYYLHNILPIENYKALMGKAMDILRRHWGEFDAIAFTGTSGALAAIPLAHALNIPMIVVRKSGEDNHSGRGVEGCVSAERYVIVDDVVASGATVRRIQRAVWQFSQAQCIGVLEFNKLENASYKDLSRYDILEDVHLYQYDSFGENAKPVPAYLYKSPNNITPQDATIHFMITTQEAIENDKVNEQEATQASQEAIRQTAAFDTAFPTLGLRKTAERSRAEAYAVIKDKQAKSFREFTSNLYGKKKWDVNVSL